MDRLLQIDNLSIHYPTRRGDVRALDDVSLDLHEGETLGIVGETGCGKSTLGKAILGVLPPNATIRGHVLFHGKDLALLDSENLRQVRGREIALIFQDPMTRLNPLMTIESHFLETIRAHENVSHGEARERAKASLSSMSVPESRIKNYPHEFSGGMRQRIMIALALSLKPSLLVADEPTTALDVIVEAQIIQILEDLKRTGKMSMMLITHNLGIVAEVCDRVAVLYAGKVVELGPVDEVFARPLHPYTQGLLTSIIHLESKELRSLDGMPPDLVSPPTGCRFHPRCPYSQTICVDQVPQLVEFRPGHYAACWFGDKFL